MKRLLIVAAAAAGALFVAKKNKDAQAERDLWAEATDSVGRN
ncbi:DLW-39 family protein [Ornithinimicrobium sp. Arc0846-15]|nr:DLW-39 family protein [Ornithinimicrobium laminariae]